MIAAAALALPVSGNVSLIGAAVAVLRA